MHYLANIILDYASKEFDIFLSLSRHVTCNVISREIPKGISERLSGAINAKVAGTIMRRIPEGTPGQI